MRESRNSAVLPSCLDELQPMVGEGRSRRRTHALLSVAGCCWRLLQWTELLSSAPDSSTRRSAHGTAAAAAPAVATRQVRLRDSSRESARDDRQPTIGGRRTEDEFGERPDCVHTLQIFQQHSNRLWPMAVGGRLLSSLLSCLSPAAPPPPSPPPRSTSYSPASTTLARLEQQCEPPGRQSAGQQPPTAPAAPIAAATDRMNKLTKPTQPPRRPTSLNRLLALI